jgi:AraC-like DNA-binding protein
VRTLGRHSWVKAPDACPVSQFTEWSCTYVREISSAHAIFAATEIARAIRHDPSRHLDMRQLSLRFNHSEEELRQSFKLLLGVSVREYQTRQRILCALRGLRTGIKADAVALDAGFKRPNKFYPCFRRITGYTPAALRPQLATFTDAELESLVLPRTGAHVTIPTRRVRQTESD